MLYLAVDGTGLPMRASETHGRAGKGPDGRSRTREAKLAALFTQTRPTTKGTRSATPTRPATWPPATGRAVRRPAHRRSPPPRQQPHPPTRRHRRRRRWIWNLADRTLPAATQVVDLDHAREHLHDLAALLEFIVLDPPPGSPTCSTDLDNGDIEALAAAARRYDLDLSGLKPTTSTRPWRTSRPTRTACATPTTANWHVRRLRRRRDDGRILRQEAVARVVRRLSTHPFHPLAGQRLTVLHERRLAGVGLVYVCDAGMRGTLALPPDYTDRGVERGSLFLDVRVLAELAHMLRALGVVDT